ncbi:MAG: ABC transporter ATP-binding protein [bacterium]|nr:ABC transporter ATP-binding protein [bacterium]
MTLIDASDLKYSYDETPVFEGVHIECRANEVTVLLGANGAGKTTLLHLIARHFNPEKGIVKFDEYDLASFSRSELAKRVALMPQHENRDSTLSVVEVVSLGRLPLVGWWAAYSKSDLEQIDQAIEVTGLESLRHRRIDELSGGEWRRMILARALVQQSSIILLDEPTAGLDLKYQFEVLRHIKRITKQNELTTIVTLHDLNHAAMFADKVSLVGDGKLIAFGPPGETLTADAIKKAFDVQVVIGEHPVLKSPLIVPVIDQVKSPLGREGSSEA